MKNYIVTIIAVIAIVGILSFFAYNYGKKAYFELGFIKETNENQEENSDEKLPTPNENQDTQKKDETKNVSNTNQNKSKPDQQSIPIQTHELTKTGDSVLPINKRKEIPNQYIIEQKTTIIINNKKYVYKQLSQANKLNSVYQKQRVQIVY